MKGKFAPWLALAVLVAASLACSLAQPEPAPSAAQPSAAPQVVEKVVTQVVEKQVAAAPAATTAPAAAAAAAAPPRPTEPRGPVSPAQEIEVNPFVDAQTDHLSTFGLDVDTGSYAIARNYIRNRELPPADTVRVEEFVNYFKQDYAYPQKGRAFAINIDGAAFPFAEAEPYRMLRIGLQGYDIPPEERKPAVLTFVIDVSGSMGDEGKLDLIKPSLTKLVNALRPTDKVAIVKYGTQASVVLPSTEVEHKQRILDAIDALHTEGSTNAEAGLKLGYEVAAEQLNREAINRVILLSDGVANVGQTGPEQILKEIEAWAKQGILMTTVGFGMGEYNDVLMEQLADHGNGFYAYVDGAREAERLFVHGLTSTLQTIALDAKVQVDFNPEVVARYRLLGFENRAIADTEFRAETPKEAGEIGAGHNVTAMYELELRPQATGKVATVYLRWTDPDSKETIEIDKEFAGVDFGASFAKAPPRFQWDVVVGECAEILRGSPYAKGNTLAGVLEEAQRVAKQLPGDEDVAEFVELMRTASTLQKQ